jgi:Tfp pilus assembly protein PilF
MSIRAKKRRRLVLAAAALTVFVGLTAGAYGLRSRQIEAKLAKGRAEGVAALTAGDYETALHKIGSYLQRHPEDADAIFQYAQAREQVPMPENRHIGQAIAQYRQLLVLRPGHQEALRRLLKLYVSNGLTQESLDAAAKLGADDPEALRAIAIVRKRQRKYGEALVASEKYNERLPDDLEMQRLTLEVLMASGSRATDIVARAKQLEAKHAGNARFDLLTAIAQRAAGDASAAKASLRKAASRGADNNPVFVRSLVEQLEAMELFEESLGVLVRAAGVGVAENRRLFVGRLFQAERFQEVADRLEDLKAPGPGADAELVALRALALFNLKQADRVPPLVAALDKRFDAGAEAWRPVLQTVTRTPPAEPAEVIRVSTEALRRVPGNPYFHHFLASAYSAAGEQERAAMHWGEATRLAPAWAAPRARVAMLFVAAGQPAEAVRVARDARDRASNNAAVLQTFGETLSASLTSRGRTDAPLAAELDATADKLASLDPANDVAVVFRVLAHAARGDKDKAVAATRAAIGDAKIMADGAYIRLASISKLFNLGLEDACLDRCERACGRVSPALAAYRARQLLAAGKAADGKRVLQAAKDSAREPADVKSWRAAWAAYLDLTSDPEARATWTALANDFASDAGIQSLALRATCLQGNRDVLDRTINRLRDATGPDAVGWRMARARWIAAGATGPDRSAQLANAASLLGELIRELPDLPEPRMLLAKCLQALGNPGEAADQLRRVVAAAPRFHAARLELAALLQGQGDSVGAKAQAEAIAQDPSASPQDRAAAAAMLARAGDGRRAREVLEKLSAAGAAPPQALLLAELYRRQGDLPKAQAVCEQVLAAGPDASAIALLSDLLAAQGQAQRAEQVLASLDTLNLPAPQKEMIRGRHYAARGDAARAGEQFAAATRAAPTSAAAWRLLARHQLASGDLKAALATAAAAKASVKDEGLAALERVAASMPDWQTDALLPLLAGVIDAPADAGAVVELLKCFAQAKQNPSARTLLAQMRQVADRNPGALVVQNIAARASLAAGRREEAGQALAIADRAAQNFPQAAEPVEIRVSALAALNRWADAAAAALQWKQRDPAASGPDLALATAHLALRQPEDAAAVLEKYAAKADDSAYATRPAVVQATALYAQALVLSNRAADAEKLLAGRIAASPQYRAAWVGLAGRYLADFAAAERWLTAAQEQAQSPTLADQAVLAEGWLALSSRSKLPAHREHAAGVVKALAAQAAGSTDAKSDVLVTVGIFCEDVGDRGTAEQLYKRALQKDADNPVAMNNLAMILADRGATADAEKFAERAAAREHPRQANFYDTLATVQAKNRKWDQAGASIGRAVALDPTNVGYQIHQAFILANAGDAAKARKAVDAVEGVRLEDPGLSETDRSRLKWLRERATAGL